MKLELPVQWTQLWFPSATLIPLLVTTPFSEQLHLREFKMEWVRLLSSSLFSRLKRAVGDWEQEGNWSVSFYHFPENIAFEYNSAILFSHPSHSQGTNRELRFATFREDNYICQLIFLFNQKDMSVLLKKNNIAKNVISFLCPETFPLPLDNGINPRTPVSSCFQSLVHSVLARSSSDSLLHCRLKVPFIFPVLPDASGAGMSSGTCH